MAVQYTEITKKDLEADSLHMLNKLLRDLVNEVNRLGGQAGSIKLEADLNLNGHKILNQGK